MDNIPSHSVQSELSTKLTQEGIDVAWATSATKVSFEFVYHLCVSTTDGVIVIGHTKLFVNFLKSRYNQDFKETFFVFDGIKFLILPKHLDKQQFDTLLDAHLQHFRPSKQTKLELYKFGVFGKSVDQVKSILSDLIENKSKIKFDFFQVEIGVFVIIRIPAKVENIVKDDILNKTFCRLQDAIYNTDTPLINQVAILLKQKNLKIAVAESYTAGGIAVELCSIEGASQYFCESVVCYSEDSKQKRLSVTSSALYEYGAVSQEVAYQMAADLLVKNPEYDIAIATTGYASAHTIDGVDVTGNCFLAIGTREGIHVWPQKFVGTREQITQKGIQHAIFVLYKMLYGAGSN